MEILVDKVEAQKVADYFEKCLKTTPHPERSGIDGDEDNSMAPTNMYERLREIAKSGKITSREDLSLYEASKFCLPK